MSGIGTSSAFLSCYCNLAKEGEPQSWVILLIALSKMISFLTCCTCLSCVLSSLVAIFLSFLRQAFASYNSLHHHASVPGTEQYAKKRFFKSMNKLIFIILEVQCNKSQRKAYLQHSSICTAYIMDNIQSVT